MILLERSWNCRYLWVLVVCLTGEASIIGHETSIIGQLTGVVMIAAFTYLTSLGSVLLINKFMPIRATDEEQDIGLDMSEIGVEAYPDFK